MRRLYILGAPWCTQCIEIYTRLREELGGENVEYVDLDRYPHLQERFDVRAYPTLVLVEGGRPLSTHIPEDHVDAKRFYREGGGENFMRRCVYRRVGPPGRDELNKVIGFIENVYDWVEGGLTGGYKLVPYREMEFLVKAYLDLGVKGYLEMVRRTVDIVLQSQMMDYRRYLISHLSYSPDWDSPDNTYLLEEQARMARLLIWLGRLTGAEVYLEIARRMVRSIFQLFLDRGVRGYLGEEPIHLGDGGLHPYVEALESLSEIGLDPRLRPRVANLAPLIPSHEKILGEYPLITQAYYLDTLLNIYRFTRWREGLRRAAVIVERWGGWIHSLPTVDTEKSLHPHLDRWVCRPVRTNLEYGLAMYRAHIYGVAADGEALGGVLSNRWDVVRRNTYDAATWGLGVAIYLNGLDLFRVSGYRGLPSKVGELLKPYTEIVYLEGGGRRVEYVSRGVSFEV